MKKQYLTRAGLVKLLLSIFVISGIMYFAAFHQIHYKSADQPDLRGSDGTVGEIVDGSVVLQAFSYSGDYLNEIGLMAGTYARQNTGLLRFAVKNAASGEVLWTGEQEAALVEDNVELRLPVRRALDGSQLLLEIQSEGCSAGNAVTFYTAAGNSDAIGALQVGGTVQDKDLLVQAYGDRARAYGRYFWCYVVVLAALAAAFWAWQEKLERRSGGGLVHYIYETLDTYRFMIKQLVSRDFKTKYKRSVLGAMWSLLNPLCTMAVQYIVFSTIFRSNIRNYPVYLLSASILFNFFNESVSGGLVSIVGNTSLITKVHVPKYIYPVTKVLSTSINLFISLIPILAVVLLTKEPIGKAYLLIPYVLLCLILFCIGMSLVMSTLMVFFRDMQFLWGIISLLWMYATPMFYPAEIIPPRFRFVLTCNPMYHYISFFRTILLEHASPQMGEYLVCLLWSLVACFVGGLIFNHYQKKFILYL